MGTLAFDDAPEPIREKLALFRQRLRAAAAASGIRSMDELARKSGVGLSALSKYLGGTRLPSMPALVQLADACGVTVDFLAGEPVELTCDRARSSAVILVAAAYQTGDERVIAYIQHRFETDETERGRAALEEFRQIVDRLGSEGNRLRCEVGVGGR